MTTLRAMGPDGSTQAAPVTRGFLFADLRGYTAFIEAHGDKQARELLDAYRRVVREVVGQFGGAEIKTEGDSFYVVFPSATAAVKCGLALVQSAAEATQARPDLPINMGVGVHAGETAESDEGYVGSAVNMAARLCSAASAGEVLVSETVRGLTRTGGEIHYVSRGNKRFKGISEPIAVFAATTATGTSAVRVQPRAFGRSRGLLGGAMAVVALVVVVAALVITRGGAAAPTASPPPATATVAGVASPTVASSPASSTPGTSAVPTQAGIKELQLGKADPGQYRASYFYHRPEFELPEGWTIGTCPSKGPVHCDNGKNNGYDPNLIQFKLSDRPQSQLVLFHPAGFLNDPCAIEARPTSSPTEPFLGWLRTQPGLEIGTGFAHNFQHVKTTEMDVNVVDEHACTTTTPHSVALGGGFNLVGGTYFALNSGSATKLYALTIPNNVFAFVTAPNQDELELLRPKAEEVLNSLEFPNE